MNQKAPVVETGQVEVAAEIEAVWQLLAAVERSPEWNPDIARRPTSMLLEVEAPRFMAWERSSRGIKTVHVWRLDRTAGGTMVTTEESWEGLIPRLLGGRSHALLERAIQSDLAHVKTHMEREASA